MSELRRADLRSESLVLLRHVERWQPPVTYARLHAHLVDGRHRLSSEDVDSALAQLLFAGFILIEDGTVSMTSRGRGL
jgi:hypothetical protein